MRQSGHYTREAWWIIWLVAVHFVVVIAHGTAHFVLGIVPPPLDSAFITFVIGLLPLIALPFVLRESRAAMVILTFAFAAAWLYGMANHFIIEGADHVAGLDHGAWPAIFTVTGILLLLLEAAGTVLAAWIFWRASKTHTQPASAGEAPLTMPR